MPNSSASNPPLDAWAEVRAHDQVMRYRRLGCGSPVLLLRAPDSSPPLWPELGETLAARHRVIVPEVPATLGDVAAWLGDFLEGLGLADAAVIAADRMCTPALELALLGQGHIGRLVLVPAGETGGTWLDGALTTPTDAPTVPLLVVRRGLPSGEAVSLIERFIAGSGGAPAR